MEQDNAGGGFVPTALDDILRAEPGASSEPAGQPAPQAQPETPRETGEAATPPPEAKDNRPRDEAGRFAPKAEAAAKPETGPPPEENAAPKHVPVSVHVEERRKWQAKAAELEAQIAALRQQPPPQPAQPQQPAAPQIAPEDLIFQDPRAFVGMLQQRQEEQLLATRLALSEALVRDKPDYADAEAALHEYARSSERAAVEVAQALRSHHAPALWAYEAGKKLLSMKPETIEARINAEVERRYAERVAQSPAPSSAPPPPASLASARSAGPRVATSTFAGPTPLTSILGRR
jgi:hypothetical protein